MDEMDDIDDIDDINLSDLDTLWLNSTETCLADYTPFYKKDLTRLTVARVYINVDGVVIRVSDNEEVLDSPNILTVRHMCALIGTDNVWKKYLYTVDIDEDTVEDMDDITCGDNFFRNLTDISQDVVIGRTIEHFHDVNTLFLLIKELHTEPDHSNDQNDISCLEIKLGNAKPLSRKNRKRPLKISDGTKTRRMH